MHFIETVPLRTESEPEEIWSPDLLDTGPSSAGQKAGGGREESAESETEHHRGVLHQFISTTSEHCNTGEPQPAADIFCST